MTKVKGIKKEISVSRCTIVVLIDTRLQSTTSGKRVELNFPERDNHERGLNNYHVMEKSVRRVHHALRADTLDRKYIVN